MNIFNYKDLKLPRLYYVNIFYILEGVSARLESELRTKHVPI